MADCKVEACLYIPGSLSLCIIYCYIDFQNPCEIKNGRKKFEVDIFYSFVSIVPAADQLVVRTSTSLMVAKLGPCSGSDEVKFFPVS